MEAFREKSDRSPDIKAFEFEGEVEAVNANVQLGIAPPPLGDISFETDDGGVWRHLSRSVRRTIDEAGFGPGGLDEILICATGTAVADAATLEFSRRRTGPTDDLRRWDFLIGNGSLSVDGAIEAASISGREGGPLVVTLVGDFTGVRPTEAQAAALRELVGYLRAKVGLIPVRAITRRIPAWTAHLAHGVEDEHSQ
jgi:hypothetical protein